MLDKEMKGAALEEPIKARVPLKSGEHVKDHEPEKAMPTRNVLFFWREIADQILKLPICQGTQGTAIERDSHRLRIEFVDR